MEWAEVASHILLRSCSVCLNQSLFVTKASWYHKEKQAFTTKIKLPDPCILFHIGKVSLHPSHTKKRYWSVISSFRLITTYFQKLVNRWQRICIAENLPLLIFRNARQCLSFDSQISVGSYSKIDKLLRLSWALEWPESFVCLFVCF